MGITDAFTQAESLSAKVSGVLGEGPAALDNATVSYAAERDRQTSDAFETNAEFAEWEMPEELLTVLKEAQHDPARVTEFFGVYAGLTPLSDFLSPR